VSARRPGPERTMGGYGRRRLLGAGLVLVAAMSAAAALGAQTGPAPPGSLEESRAQLAAEGEHVARGPLGHLRWRPEPAVAPALCDGPDGRPADRERAASFGLEAPLPAGEDPIETVASVQAAWRARGLAEVRRDDANPGVAVTTARRDGLLLEVVVNGRSRRAFVGGSTPCLVP